MTASCPSSIAVFSYDSGSHATAFLSTKMPLASALAKASLEFLARETDIIQGCTLLIGVNTPSVIAYANQYVVGNLSEALDSALALLTHEKVELPLTESQLLKLSNFYNDGYLDGLSIPEAIQDCPNFMGSGHSSDSITRKIEQLALKLSDGLNERGVSINSYELYLLIWVIRIATVIEDFKS